MKKATKDFYKRIIASILSAILIVSFCLTDLGAVFAAQEYIVTLSNTDENGTLVFNPETMDSNERASMSGSKVTLYAKCNDSYALDTLKVTNTSNNKSVVCDISIADTGLYEITFTMPKGNVSVAASYTLADANIYTITEGKVETTEIYLKSNINKQYVDIKKFEPYDALIVKNTMVIGSLINGEKTIDNLWSDDLKNEESLLGQEVSPVILFNVDDDSEYLVAFANTMQNNSDSSVTDIAFARNNSNGEAFDNCIYDYETGIAYIPKSNLHWIEEELQVGSVQIQLLHCFEAESIEDATANVSFNITTKGVEGDVASSGTIESSLIDSYISVLIAKDDVAKKSIKKDDITIAVNGIALANDLYDYDEELGVLSVASKAVQSSVIDINIDSTRTVSEIIEEKTTALLDDLGLIASAAYSDYKNSFDTFHTNPSGQEVTWTFSKKPVVGTFFEQKYKVGSYQQHPGLYNNFQWNTDFAVYYVGSTYGGKDISQLGNANYVNGVYGLGHLNENSTMWENIYRPNSNSSSSTNPDTYGFNYYYRYWVNHPSIFTLGVNIRSGYNTTLSDGNKFTVKQNDTIGLQCAHVTSAANLYDDVYYTLRGRILAVEGNDKSGYILIGMATNASSDVKTQAGIGVVKLHYDVTSHYYGALKLFKIKNGEESTYAGGAVYALIDGGLGSPSETAIMGYAKTAYETGSASNAKNMTAGPTTGHTISYLKGFFTTDANGTPVNLKKANGTDVVLDMGANDSGKYYVVEIYPAAGYKRDTNVYSFTLNNHGNGSSSYETAATKSTISDLVVAARGTVSDSSIETNTGFMGIYGSNNQDSTLVLRARDESTVKYAGLRINKDFADGTSANFAYSKLIDMFPSMYDITTIKYSTYTDENCTNKIADWKLVKDEDHSTTLSCEYRLVVDKVYGTGLSIKDYASTNNVVWGLTPNTTYYTKETVYSNAFTPYSERVFETKTPEGTSEYTVSNTAVSGYWYTFGNANNSTRDEMLNLTKTGSITVNKSAADGASASSQAGAVFELYYRPSLNAAEYPVLNITTNNNKTSRTVTMGTDTHHIGTFTIGSNGKPIPTALTISANGLDYTPTVNGVYLEGLPIGNYTLVETKAPTNNMYKLSSDERWNRQITGSNNTTPITISVTDPEVSDPISIEITKANSNGSTTPKSLAGTVFKVTFWSYVDNNAYLTKTTAASTTPTKTWYIETKSLNGKYRANLFSEYLASGYTSSSLYDGGNLPVGTVMIEEVKAATGYVLESGTVKVGNTTYDDRKFIGWIKPNPENTQGVSLYIGATTAASSTVKVDNLSIDATNDDGRGNFYFYKVSSDASGKHRLANVEFEIKNNETGEKYTIRTDANGNYNSVTDTSLLFKNGGDASKIDATKGKLYYGTYTLTELSCTANNNMILADPITFTILNTNNSVDASVNVGEIINYVPYLSTTALDSDTGTHYSKADGSITIFDTVTMSNLKASTAYTVAGIVMDISGTTPVPYKDNAGNYVRVLSNFTSASSTTGITNGTKTLGFQFNGLNAKGKKLVLYTYLYTGTITNMNNLITVDASNQVVVYNPVVSHNSPTNTNEMIYLPTISTTAKDSQTLTNVSNADTSITLTDTVTYSNLAPSTSYKLTATLMNKNGTVYYDDAGKSVTTTVTFTSSSTGSGTKDVTVTFSGTNLKGKDVVFYEELFTSDNKSLAEHKVATDEGQTVHFVSVSTTARDSQTLTDISNADGSITLIDKVHVTNLKVGMKYYLVATLYDRTTGKPYLDDNGKVVQSETDITKVTMYTAASATEDRDVSFTFSGENLKGKSVVFYEKLYYANGTELANHEDISDAGQTINFPSVGTTATSGTTNDHIGKTSGTETINDVVTYTNLVVGKEYTLNARLVDKATKAVLKDASGADIVITKKFTPTTKNGSETITFTVDASLLVGKTTVVFERLYYNNIEVAAHTQLSDEGQTIHFPSVGTTATSGSTNDHLGKTSGTETIYDVVSYTNLIVGKEYTLNGRLVDKASRAVLKDASGTDIIVTKKFTPKSSSGTETITFTVDASLLVGKTTVVFERLYYNNIEVAAHTQLSDEGQTIHFPEIGTTATSGTTNDHLGKTSGTETINDVVSYKNLIPNKEYTLNGRLVDKASRAVLKDASGADIIVTKKFTPTTADGTYTITFTVDASLLVGKTTVVFERLYYDNVEIAAHTQLSDEGQTIHFPSIGTTATDNITKNHDSNTNGVITINDKVNYTNLIVGKSYTITGKLVNKANGATIKDKYNKDVTATKTFTATKADGSVDIVFTFEGSFAGVTTVAFESLKFNNIELATHADIDDKEQTIKFSSVSTTAKDSETLEGIGKADTSITLTDTVKIENLTIGNKYYLVATLYDKTTKAPYLDDTNKTVTLKTAIFTATDETMTKDVTVTFSGVNLKGKDVVFFEKLFNESDIELANHEDINDEGQTVHFPDGSTQAKDSETHTNIANADTSVTIIDTVSFTNLVPNKEYKITGTLMDKTTGKALNVAGATVTTTFIPKTANGTTTMTFTFDGSALKGKDIVVFESVYRNNKEVFVHADINDENQTIHVPSVTTNLNSLLNNEITYEGSKYPFVDTVSITNVLKGQKYVIKSYFYDKATGKLVEVEGSTDGLRGSKEFTASDINLDVDVDMTSNIMGYKDHTYVAYEYLYIINDEGNEILVASEENINNEAQSKDIVENLHLPTTGSSSAILMQLLSLVMILGGFIVLRKKEN